MDYQNGKIYRIVCEETQRVYIGSTSSTLVKRLSTHKSKIKSGVNHCAWKDFINPKIFLIEDYPCDRKEQLLMRERYHMENTECVNLNRPIRTDTERKEQKKEKVTCSCGSDISSRNFARHKKSYCSEIMRN